VVSRWQSLPTYAASSASAEAARRSRSAVETPSKNQASTFRPRLRSSGDTFEAGSAFSAAASSRETRCLRWLRARRSSWLISRSIHRSSRGAGLGRSTTSRVATLLTTAWRAPRTRLPGSSGSDDPDSSLSPKSTNGRRARKATGTTQKGSPPDPSTSSSAYRGASRGIVSVMLLEKLAAVSPLRSTVRTWRCTQVFGLTRYCSKLSRKAGSANAAARSGTARGPSIRSAVSAFCSCTHAGSIMAGGGGFAGVDDAARGGGSPEAVVARRSPWRIRRYVTVPCYRDT
jgi:hypothetical protein